MDVIFRLPVINTIHLTLFGEITEIKVPTSHSLSIILLFVLICSFVFYFSKRERKCVFALSNQFFMCSLYFVVVDGSNMFWWKLQSLEPPKFILIHTYLSHYHIVYFSSSQMGAICSQGGTWKIKLLLLAKVDSYIDIRSQQCTTLFCLIFSSLTVIFCPHTSFLNLPWPTLTSQHMSLVIEKRTRLLGYLLGIWVFFYAGNWIVVSLCVFPRVRWNSVHRIMLPCFSLDK